jgi:hypothetical protein
MLPAGGRHWQLISPHWDFVEFIFLAGFASQGFLNKDSTVWQEGARPPPLVLMVLPLPENELGKVKGSQTKYPAIFKS